MWAVLGWDRSRVDRRGSEGSRSSSSSPSSRSWACSQRSPPSPSRASSGSSADATCASDAKSVASAEDTAMAATGVYLSEDDAAEPGLHPSRVTVVRRGAERDDAVPVGAGRRLCEPGRDRDPEHAAGHGWPGYDTAGSGRDQQGRRRPDECIEPPLERHLHRECDRRRGEQLQTGRRRMASGARRRSPQSPAPDRSGSSAPTAGTGTGTLGLNLVNKGAVVDLAGNALATQNFTGAAYTIDLTVRRSCRSTGLELHRRSRARPHRGR